MTASPAVAKAAVSADTVPIMSSSAREAVIARIHHLLDPVVATGCRLATMDVKALTAATTNVGYPPAPRS